MRFILVCIFGTPKGHAKTQLLQAGYEVSDDTENWIAMKIKVVAYILDRKYGEKPKEPSKEDEAEVMREILPQPPELKDKK